MCNALLSYIIALVVDINEWMDGCLTATEFDSFESCGYVVLAVTLGTFYSISLNG